MIPLKPWMEWLNLLLDFCTLFSSTQKIHSLVIILTVNVGTTAWFFLCQGYLPKLSTVGVGREAISLCSLPSHARMYLCDVITVLNQLNLLPF